MAKVFRVLLAVIGGLFVGSVANMGLILISGSVIPPPAGADVKTVEGLQASMHLFESKHFVFPFLAHALGTLVGASVATLLAPSRSFVPAGIVGGMFLLGGITNVALLPSPVWFSVLDLLVAYAPMAWLGYLLAARFRWGRAPAV